MGKPENPTGECPVNLHVTSNPAELHVWVGFFMESSHDLPPLMPQVALAPCRYETF